MVICRLDDDKYMKFAIEQAKIAASMGEIPVGAVIVSNGDIVSTGYNKREMLTNSLAHAEIVAINSACKKLNSWRILNATLYVTLEPCAMCAGAIINSRIEKVVFGTYDPKAGSFGSLVDLSELRYNHQPQIVSGVCEKECADLLSNFFRELRKKKKLL